MPKYKIEDQGRLKCARMSNNIRTDKYIHDIKYNWKITPDVDDNNFDPLVNKIIDSNESYFITGPGGAGKSTLINMLKQKIRELNEDDEDDVQGTRASACGLVEVDYKKDNTTIIKFKIRLNPRKRNKKQLLKILTRKLKPKNQN